MAAQHAHPPIASASLDPRGIPQFLRGPSDQNEVKSSSSSIAVASSSSTTASTPSQAIQNKRHGSQKPGSRMRSPPIPHGRSTSRSYAYPLLLDGVHPITPQAAILAMCALTAFGYTAYHLYKSANGKVQRDKAERSARELIEAEHQSQGRDKDKKLVEKGRDRKGSTGGARRLSSADRDREGDAAGGANGAHHRDKGQYLSVDGRESEQDGRSRGQDGINANVDAQCRQRSSSSSSSRDRNQGLTVDTSIHGSQDNILPGVSSSSFGTALPPIFETYTMINESTVDPATPTIARLDSPSILSNGKKVKRPSKERRKLERITSARETAVVDQSSGQATTPRTQQDLGVEKEEDRLDNDAVMQKSGDEEVQDDIPELEMRSGSPAAITPATTQPDPVELLSATSSNASWSQVNGKSKAKRSINGSGPIHNPLTLTNGHTNGNGLSAGMRRTSEDHLSSATSFTTQSEREESMSVTSEISKSSSFSPIDGPLRRRQVNGRQASMTSNSNANGKPRKSVPGSAGWTRPTESNASGSHSRPETRGVPELSVTSPVEEHEPGTVRNRQRSGGGKDTSDYRALAAERDRLVEDNTRLSSLLALSNNKESQALTDLEKSQARAREMEAEASRWKSENDNTKRELSSLNNQRPRMDENRNRDDQQKRYNGNITGGRGRDPAMRGRGGLRGRMSSGSGYEINQWELEVDNLRREVDRRAIDQQRRESEFQALMQQQAAQLVQALHHTAFLDQALRTERAAHTSHPLVNGTAFPASPLASGGSPYLPMYSGQINPSPNQSAYLYPVKTSQPPSPQPSPHVQVGSPWAALNMPMSPSLTRSNGTTPLGKTSQEDLSKHLAWTVLKKREGSPPTAQRAAEGANGEEAGGPLRDSATVHGFATAEPLEHGNDDNAIGGLTSSASLPAGFVRVSPPSKAHPGSTSPRSTADNASNYDEDEDTSVPLFASVHHDPAHIQALMIQAELDREERGRRASLRRGSGTSSGTSNDQVSPAAQTARKLFGNAISRFESGGPSGELSPFGSRSTSTATTAMSSLDETDQAAAGRNEGAVEKQEDAQVVEGDGDVAELRFGRI